MASSLPSEEPGVVGSPALAVAAVADDEVRRRRLAATLERDGFRLVAQSSDPSALLADLARSALDAVVIAHDRFDHVQASALRELTDGLPGVKVVAVAASFGAGGVREAFAHGAHSLVLEAQTEACLGLAVRAACAGQLSFPGELQVHLIRPILSAREKQILAMVVLGFTNREIAGRLFIAESTVKSHLSSSFAKLKVRSRYEATALILDDETGLGAGILGIPKAEPTAWSGSQWESAGQGAPVWS
jgi:DNA-binding NarL/FixJ family response regulator